MRTKEIKIRLTADEHATLLSRAGHIRLAAWMRASCLHRMPPQIPAANIEILEQLRGIGGNLNQLAKHANTTGHLDLNAIRDQVSDLRATLIGATK